MEYELYKCLLMVEHGHGGNRKDQGASEHITDKVSRLPFIIQYRPGTCLHFIKKRGGHAALHVGTKYGVEAK